MDIDEFKQHWQSIDIKHDELDAANDEMRRRLAGGSVLSARQQLIRLFCVRGMVAAMLPLIAVTGYEIVVDTSLWIFYGLFGVIMSIVNFRFAHKIKKTDYISMPTVDALNAATGLLRQKQLVTTISLVIVMVMLLLLVAVIWDEGEQQLLLWVGAGIVIGAVIAYMQWRRTNKLVRAMISGLEDMPVR